LAGHAQDAARRPHRGAQAQDRAVPDPDPQFHPRVAAGVAGGADRDRTVAARPRRPAAVDALPPGRRGRVRVPRARRRPRPPQPVRTLTVGRGYAPPHPAPHAVGPPTPRATAVGRGYAPDAPRPPIHARPHGTRRTCDGLPVTAPAPSAGSTRTRGPAGCTRPR